MASTQNKPVNNKCSPVAPGEVTRQRRGALKLLPGSNKLVSMVTKHSTLRLVLPSFQPTQTPIFAMVTRGLVCNKDNNVFSSPAHHSVRN